MRFFLITKKQILVNLLTIFIFIIIFFTFKDSNSFAMEFSKNSKAWIWWGTLISYLRSEGYQFKNFYDFFQNIV